LMCNLMIRRRMVPRSEGVRLYFINNQTPGFFSAIAASSNPALNQTRRTEAVLFPKSPAAGWLALRYVSRSAQ
jgi:hypothetical protein